MPLLKQLMNKPFEVQNVEIESHELKFNTTFSNSSNDLETRQLATIALTTPEGIFRGEFPTLDLAGYDAPGTEAVIGNARANVEKLVGHSVNCGDIEKLESFDSATTLGVQSALVMGGLSIEPTSTYVPVKASAVVSASTPIDKLQELAELGFSRFKIKISPSVDLGWLETVVTKFPNMQIDVDANGSFAGTEVTTAVRVLMSGVTVFEQPFSPSESNSLEAEQLGACTQGEQYISADESASSPDAVSAAITSGAFNAVCVKPFRYGSLGATLEAAGSLLESGTQVQLGGLLEAGVGRTMLALIQNELDLSLTGDISPASYLYEAQPLPDLTLVDGSLSLPT